MDSYLHKHSDSFCVISLIYPLIYSFIRFFAFSLKSASAQNPTNAMKPAGDGGFCIRLFIVWGILAVAFIDLASGLAFPDISASRDATLGVDPGMIWVTMSLSLSTTPHASRISVSISPTSLTQQWSFKTPLCVVAASKSVTGSSGLRNLVCSTTSCTGSIPNELTLNPFYVGCSGVSTTIATSVSLYVDVTADISQAVGDIPVVYTANNVLVATLLPNIPFTHAFVKWSSPIAGGKQSSFTIEIGPVHNSFNVVKLKFPNEPYFEHTLPASCNVQHDSAYDRT